MQPLNNQLTSKQIIDAIAIYQRLAWPLGAPARRSPPALDADAPLLETLSRLELDSASGGGERRVLRLGNHAYPHMKLVVEMMPGAGWFFGADCHDQAVKCATDADRQAWSSVLEQNAAIKAAIEQAWRDADLPTLGKRCTQVMSRESMRERTLARSISARLKVPVTKPLVMVVDDEEELAELLAIYLRMEGFRTVVVTSAPDVVAMARRLKPDLILLDYMMPQKSGVEVCRELKAEPELAEIPTMICTYADCESVRKACAVEVLPKPLERSVLIRKVQEQLAASARMR